MRKFWDKTNKHKTITIVSAAVAFVAVITIAVAVFISVRNQTVNPAVLTIDGKEILKDRYDRLVSQGSKYDIPDKDVREIIIEYYKNQAAADKLNIEVNPKYPQLSRGQMIGQNLRDGQKKYDFESLSESSDEIAKMMIYNTTFEVRKQSIALGGYSLVVFDFPTAANPYADQDELKKRTKADAEKVRQMIVSGQVTGDKAIKEAARINSAAGRSSLSGYYFVTDSKDAIGGVSGTGIQTFGFLEKYVKTLKDKGLSEVSVTQNNDYFFVDYLYYDKANPDINSQVQSVKNKVRVVQHDN